LIIGAKGGASDSTETRDGEAPTTHIGKLDLALSSGIREFTHLAGYCRYALFVHVANNRDDQPVRSADCEPEMKILLENQIIAIERGVEFGELSESATTPFRTKLSNVTLVPSLELSRLTSQRLRLSFIFQVFSVTAKIREPRRTAIGSTSLSHLTKLSKGR
jgi:hypothetical protein